MPHPVVEIREQSYTILLGHSHSPLKSLLFGMSAIRQSDRIKNLSGALKVKEKGKGLDSLSFGHTRGVRSSLASFPADFSSFFSLSYQKEPKTRPTDRWTGDSCDARGAGDRRSWPMRTGTGKCKCRASKTLFNFVHFFAF